MTGLRREQSPTRENLDIKVWDDANGLDKFNPLLEWSVDEVWTYICTNDVPYNSLHDAGYPSIGCGPCTRAVEPGEDIRSGRWVVGECRFQGVRPARGQTIVIMDVKAHLSHLDTLEDESIFILREVAAEFRNPVILYSIGKDSSVLVHLARKAFHPAPIPFPPVAHRYGIQVPGDDRVSR